MAQLKRGATWLETSAILAREFGKQAVWCNLNIKAFDGAIIYGRPADQPPRLAFFNEIYKGPWTRDHVFIRVFGFPVSKIAKSWRVCQISPGAHVLGGASSLCSRSKSFCKNETLRCYLPKSSGGQDAT